MKRILVLIVALMMLCVVQATASTIDPAAVTDTTAAGGVVANVATVADGSVSIVMKEGMLSAFVVLLIILSAADLTLSILSIIKSRMEGKLKKHTLRYARDQPKAA